MILMTINDNHDHALISNPLRRRWEQGLHMVTQQRHANNPKTRLTNFLTITSPQIVYPMEHHVDNRIAKMVSNTTVVKRVLLGSPTRKSIISVTLCAWTFSNPLFLFQERQHPNFNKVHSSLNTNAMIRMVVNASQCVELRMLAVLQYWFCRRRVCLVPGPSELVKAQAIRAETAKEAVQLLLMKSINPFDVHFYQSRSFTMAWSVDHLYSVHLLYREQLLTYIVAAV